MEEKNIAQMRAELRDFYFNKVKPQLSGMNERRRKNAASVHAVMLLLAGFVLINIIPPLGVILVLAGMFMLIFLGRQAEHSGRKNTVVIDTTGEEEFKKKFMPEFLQIFGNLMTWTKNTDNATMEDFKYYKSLNIMNPFFLLSFDDNIAGKYKDVNFNILEMDTSISSAGNFILFLLVGGGGVYLGCFVFLFLSAILVPAAMHMGIFGLVLIVLYFLTPPVIGLYKLIKRVPFRGVFVEFDMNKNFEGHTFLFERAATNKSIKIDPSKFQEVKLEDPEFSSKYIVYSDNQVEARYVLTTAFIERFKNMKTAFKAKYIRAAFKEGKITIAIHAGRDLFAMASLSKDTNSNTFTELFDEILSVLGFIEALKLNLKIGL